MTNGTHPRPQLQRQHWRDLGGRWRFAYDDEGRWSRPDRVRFDREIVVPYPPESEASGVGDTGFHKVVWYSRTVELGPQERPVPGERRLLLHFGAVDYAARVWANGRPVAVHRGGHTPFTADVTDALEGFDALEIVVRAEDDPHDLEQPRGKQDWLLTPHAIWYPRTTGIWQPVWLEVVPETRIARLAWTPHLERWEIGVEARVEGPMRPGTELRVRLTNGETVLADDRCLLTGRRFTRRVALADPGVDDPRSDLLWSPEHPNLIAAEVELLHGGVVLDRVQSYTALRSVGVDAKHFTLNGRPYYLRLVLDQGYWPDTLMAASDERLRRDVELAKRLGFNGVRKHQKLEDPRWLYWCDRLGLLAWGEMPSHYAFTAEAVERLVGEWTEAIRRDYSHPCVVAWVPFNESWGVPDLAANAATRDYVRALYHLTRTLDPTRPVVGNDGWEHVATDIVGVHDYALDPATLLRRYGSVADTKQTLEGERPGERVLALDGFHPHGLPVVLSEFGGVDDVSSEVGPPDRRARDAEHLLVWYEALMAAVHRCEGLAGFCYTQLTDTFYERNGLLTAEREPRGQLERIAAATRGERNAAVDLDPLGHSARWRRRAGRLKGGTVA